jgi:uncharacterized protein (DUF849 family)
MSFSKLMVAPNGAYKTTADHENLPVSVGATVATAKACYAAGADALHAHVRDAEQRHVLDAGLYTELLQAMAEQVPDMEVQITTEAGGVYDARFQRQFIADLMPSYMSLSFAEMTRDTTMADVVAFYRDLCASQIKVQHIFYSSAELTTFLQHVAPLLSDWTRHHGLFVLGRYAQGQQSMPQDLVPFLAVLQANQVDMSWAVCAFGQQQLACLLEANKLGGSMRIGFENAWQDLAGNKLSSNEDLVALMVDMLP